MKKSFTPHLVKPRHLWRGCRGANKNSSSRKPRSLERGAGFTLLELTIVIIIIGILAGITLPFFYRPKEHALGKEAIANLKFIAAAERFYRMENGTNYYPATGVTVDNITLINNNLRLWLTNTSWDYSITGGANSFNASANRKGSGGYLNCTYNITQNDSDGEPDPNTWCP